MLVVCWSASRKEPCTPSIMLTSGRTVALASVAKEIATITKIVLRARTVTAWYQSIRALDGSTASVYNTDA